MSILSARFVACLTLFCVGPIVAPAIAWSNEQALSIRSSDVLMILKSKTKGVEHVAKITFSTHASPGIIVRLEGKRHGDYCVSDYRGHKMQILNAARAANIPIFSQALRAR